MKKSLQYGVSRVAGANNYRADGTCWFWHREETGTIHLNAWHEDLWMELTHSYFDDHEEIFPRIGLSYDKGAENVVCRFTEAQARAFTLLHVFVHDLGHHHDHQHQKHHSASKGEDYAERFANVRLDQLYPAYVRVFGDPSRED